MNLIDRLKHVMKLNNLSASAFADEIGVQRSSISHILSDVYEISDKFIILDRGKVVATIKKSEVTLKKLSEFMLKYAHVK